MEDIAREAGISRAGLYLEFRNKEEIFTSVSQTLCEPALAAALDGEGPLAERLTAALLGKNLRIVELVHDSPHAFTLRTVVPPRRPHPAGSASAPFLQDCAAAARRSRG